MANPAGALPRTSFTERFLSGEDSLFDEGRGSIPFPKDATAKFRDDGESNAAISEEILSLGFTDETENDYRSSYASQLLEAGFSYPLDEEGKTITYTEQDPSWKMEKIAKAQKDYLQQSDCSVLMQYDEDTHQIYVGFTFWNKDLESAGLTYPNALLGAWNQEHGDQATPFFPFPASEHLVATLIEGDLLHEHYGFFHLAFDSLEGARAYYDSYAAAAEEASWKKGTSAIEEDASSTSSVNDGNYFYFYGPQDKTILMYGLYSDSNGHAIIAFSFDVGRVANSTLRNEGLTR